MTWGYDAWRLQSAEDAGFYRFDESDDEEEDDVERADQCVVESRAYLYRAGDDCRNARNGMSGYPSPATVLESIKQARAALDEAELRINGLVKIRNAAKQSAGDDLPW